MHSQAKTPMVLCIVHVGKGSEEMYFLSVIILLLDRKYALRGKLVRMCGR